MGKSKQTPQPKPKPQPQQQPPPPPPPPQVDERLIGTEHKDGDNTIIPPRLPIIEQK